MVDLPSSEKLNLHICLIFNSHNWQVYPNLGYIFGSPTKLRWQHYTAPEIAFERITRNCHLIKILIFFYKIQFNFTYCNFIYCPSKVLHGIHHHKYRFYKFQTFLWVIKSFLKKCFMVYCRCIN